MKKSEYRRRIKELEEKLEISDGLLYSKFPNKELESYIKGSIGDRAERLVNELRGNAWRKDLVGL